MQPQVRNQADMKDLPLHVVNTFPCEVFFENSFRHSFISFVTPPSEPRISAIIFSINGTIYAKSCILVPISSRLVFQYTYPTVTICDGERTFHFQFCSTSLLENFVTLVYQRYRETARNKLSIKKVYEAFFPPHVATHYVNSLPNADPSTVIQSTFRLGQSSVFQNPTAVAMLMQSEKLIRTYTDLTIWVSTWNIGEKDPPDNLRDLFSQQGNSIDVYVFGCQEIDMGAECILTGSAPRKTKWDAAFQTAISKTESFTRIATYQLGTCYVIAFIRSKFSTRVSEVATSEIVLGSMGFYNKTAISIRFQIDDTQVCFICAHLSHGNKNVERRNKEVALIQQDMVFETSYGLVHVADHDAAFWFGDFNYRLTIPDPQSRRRCNDFHYLLEHDQLRLAHQKKKAFVGYIENPILFQFTYKFDKNSMNIDTSSKQRGPAWCDRIFYKASSTILQMREYNANHDMQMSDHHPVYGIFHLTPWVTDQAKAAKLYQDVEEKVNLLQWSCKITPEKLQFSEIRLGEQKTMTINLKNDGQVPVLFAVKTPPAYIKVEPMNGTVQVGQTMEVCVSIFIDHNTQMIDPVISPQIFNVLEIFFANDRPITVITIQANYLVSPVGMPFEFLERIQRPISEIPASFFQPLIPGDILSSPCMKLSTFIDIPSEVWMLVDELVQIGNDPMLFFKGGESTEVNMIFEYLRVRKKFNHQFSQYSIGEALMSFLSSFYNPIISASMAREWTANPERLMEISVSMRPENVRLLDYLMCFLQYLVRFVWLNVGQKASLYKRWAQVFVGRQIYTDPEIVPIAAEMIAALVTLWDHVK